MYHNDWRDDIQDTVTGFILAGVGHRGTDGETNFLVVKAGT